MVLHIILPKTNFMKKTNDNIFETLAENKRRRDIITSILLKTEALPHLSFSKKRLRDGDFWSGDGAITKGTIMIMDLPEDLGLKEMVIAALKSEFDRLQKEFDSYTINK